MSQPSSWSVEYDRGLAARQRGDLSVSLYGDRMFSHAFLEPEENFFDRGISKNARVELVVSVAESVGAEWNANPTNEDVNPNVPAQIGVIFWRNWEGEFSRWYSDLRITLTPGIHRTVTPVKLMFWRSVLGKGGDDTRNTRDHFRRAWAGEGRIGVCAGGQFYGHGVSMVSGSAVLRVFALRVRP